MQYLFRQVFSNKTKTNQKYYCLLAIVTMLLFGSCQKENLAYAALNNSTSSNDSSEVRLRFPFGNTGTNPENNTSVNNSQYGALISPPSDDVWLGFQVNVANELGISYLRGTTLVPAKWAMNNFLNSGYKAILNFETEHRYGVAPFPSDLSQYKANLEAVLATYTVMPVVAVIENEEANRLYYTGTPQDYINELKVAIDVMHARGIKVANGGLTNMGLSYVVYQDLLKQGKVDSAQRFKEQTGLTPDYKPIQDRGAFIDALLNAYKMMSLDYVNFHWKGKSPDMDALGKVISYLQKRTNKPIISNELGQFDQDPNTVTAILQKCTDAGFPYVIWYSPDKKDNNPDTPLQYSDGTLTPSGIAFRNFLAK